MARIFVFLGAFNGLIAVILGAYASHDLQGKLSTRMLNAFQTGVDYQGVHALALLATGLLLLHVPGSRWVGFAGWAFFVGTLLFSGSLYALVFIDTRGLGLLTPVGGTILIIAWFTLLIAALRDMR